MISFNVITILLTIILFMLVSNSHWKNFQDSNNPTYKKYFPDQQWNNNESQQKTIDFTEF